MKLLEAIAYSNGNKAEGINDQGHRVIVQERYAPVQEPWYHVWHLHGGEVTQFNLAINALSSLRNVCSVDADADCWDPVR